MNLPTKQEWESLTMKIKVTQEDIAKGIPEDEGSCPVALALKHAGMMDVEVSLERAEAWYGRRLFNVELPSKARRFIKRFDAGKLVKPFSFTLNIK